MIYQKVRIELFDDVSEINREIVVDLTDATAEIRAHVRALHDWQYGKDLAAAIAAGPADPGVVS